MSEIEATKFYVRHREGYPETELQDKARRGFWTLGVETAPFEWIDDIDGFEDLGPTVGIAGYIGDVHRGLQKLGRTIPPNVDYPDELIMYLGRELRTGTLGEIRNTLGPWFVKPLTDHKLFSGFVWHGTSECRRRIVTLPDEVPVWISEPVEFVAEYRSLILRDEIQDVRRYKGDWSKAPPRRIEEAVERMKGKAPRAYCLDWGITSDGRCLLVEMNEGFSFGPYGLHPVTYAKMLSARWYELAGGT